MPRFSRFYDSLSHAFAAIATSRAQRVGLPGALYMNGSFTLNFGVLLMAACAIATFGLLENNAAVIIGAMIIAPLVLPIESVAFGAVEGNVGLVRRGLLTILLGTFAAVLFAAALSLITAIPGYGSEIVARSKPTLLDLGIAVVAGSVGAFARVRPAISATLAGTAISVALMPPLCVIGIALAHADPRLAYGSTLLYATNLLGITLASMVVYQLAGIGHTNTGRRAILTTAALTVLLGIPLGAEFFSLLLDARVETTLRRELLTNTQTFHHVDLIRIDFNWLTKPPEVTLVVRSANPLTPGQVAALERFAQLKTGHRLRLIFEVTPTTEVRADPGIPF